MQAGIYYSTGAGTCVTVDHKDIAGCRHGAVGSRHSILDLEMILCSIYNMHISDVNVKSITENLQHAFNGYCKCYMHNSDRFYGTIYPIPRQQ